MNDGRYVVLGLARPRASWFSEVSRWASAGAAPIEFIRCVSAEEVRARLGSGRAFSALLVDGGANGLDRDLCDQVRSCGAAVLIVDDGATARDWAALEPSEVLLAGFDRAELAGALDAQAKAVQVVRALPADRGPIPAEAGPAGRVCVLLGAGGTGVSFLAIGLAQSFAEQCSAGMSAHRGRASVVLADLALHADQAMLHDAPDIVPGLTELVDAHRANRLTTSEVTNMTFTVADRGYNLLLGLRRHRDWAALRPRAVDAAVRSLRAAFGTVVIDTDADLEGESDCGAVEVEERNVLARTATRYADVVFVVGTAGMKGAHALARTIAGCVAGGVAPERIIVVINGAPRQPRRRAELSAAVTSLITRVVGSAPMASPVFVVHQRRAESCLRDGARLPAGVGDTLRTAAVAVFDRYPLDASEGWDDAALAISPGSIGSFSDERAAS